MQHIFIVEILETPPKTIGINIGECHYFDAVKQLDGYLTSFTKNIYHVVKHHYVTNMITLLGYSI